MFTNALLYPCPGKRTLDVNSQKYKKSRIPIESGLQVLQVSTVLGVKLRNDWQGVLISANYAYKSTTGVGAQSGAKFCNRQPGDLE